MNEDNKKAITVSFLVISILVGFVVHLMFQFLAQAFTVIARVESNDVLSNGIPVLLGAITFASLQFNKKVVEYGDSVVSELRKVVWPSRKDTGLMTVVVVITLIFSGIVMGVYDSIWQFVINSLMK